ncbi:hypothetical protein MNBD_CHLOROFLEXI01-2910 [hydrothermal vent metagenome]|uniref:YcfA family protein n=1 Tax=hydrothermal vent metagenome TaxID=652676 RepID=A0A3B0VNQ6_9ZZZZ
MRWKNIKARDLQILIGKLDLKDGKNRSAPHRKYWYYLDGKKHHRITLPNIHGGSGSISTGFLQKIRNQLSVTNPQFIDLINCPLSAKEYEKIIRNK